MPNYQLGKIYTVRSRSRRDLVYVGSTTQPLSKRMAMHRSVKNCSSKVIVDIGDSYIELIENFPCADKYELGARENQHMRALVCVNKQSAVDDCPHGKTQSRCVECNGRGLCEHNRVRSACKECGGSQVCEHNRIRTVCKYCGGASICEHQTQRRMCKKCGGVSMCKHDRRLNTCKECGGTSVCEHSRLRDQCKECRGTKICEHGNRRKSCKECFPVECDFCNETYAKSSIGRHLKTIRHKKKYVAEFKRVFDADMTLEEVPEF